MQLMSTPQHYHTCSSRSLECSSRISTSFVIVIVLELRSLKSLLLPLLPIFVKCWRCSSEISESLAKVDDPTETIISIVFSLSRYASGGNVTGFISCVDCLVWTEGLFRKDLLNFKDWWTVLRGRICRQWAIMWPPMTGSDATSKETAPSIAAHHDNLLSIDSQKILHVEIIFALKELPCSHEDDSYNRRCSNKAVEGK